MLLDRLAQSWLNYRLNQVVKKQGWDIPEPEILKLELEPGRMDLRLRHPVFSQFAAEVADTFLESGAENFLAINIATIKGAYEIVIKAVKPGVKTTAQVLGELRAEIESLNHQLTEERAKKL